MRTLGVYLLLAVTPAAGFGLALLVLDRVVRTGPSSRWSRRRPSPPAGRPLDRLVQDLRRLEADYRRIEGADQPGRSRRLRAVGLAYDDTLRACCRSVGLSEPGTPPLSPVHRLETEAALAQCGVTW